MYIHTYTCIRMYNQWLTVLFYLSACRLSSSSFVFVCLFISFSCSICFVASVVSTCCAHSCCIVIVIVIVVVVMLSLLAVIDTPNTKHLQTDDAFNFPDLCLLSTRTFVLNCRLSLSRFSCYLQLIIDQSPQSSNYFFSLAPKVRLNINQLANSPVTIGNENLELEFTSLVRNMR